MSERITLVPPPCPVVLAVGCRGALVAHLRDATADLPVDVDLVEVVELANAATLTRPRAILFMVDTYAFDPDAFDALTSSVGARRILVEEDETYEHLESLLAGALGEPAHREAREEPQAPVTPNRSGVRWTAARGVEVVRDEAAGDRQRRR